MSETHLEDLADRIKPRTASSMMLWGITIFVILFIAWAALTELERTVRGQGRVIPSSELQVVSNLEGGIIEEILVRTGEMVREGQALLRLDPTQTGSELGSGQASVAVLAAKIARLQAEVAGREPVYPPAANETIAQQIAIERSLHASRMADLASMTGGARARLTQAERAVAEAQSAYQARVSARDARIAEANMLRPLVERGIEPRMSLMQAESAAAVATSEASAAAQSISRARASVAEAQAAIAQIRQDWRAQAANELAAAQGELAARRASMPALAERVDRTVVRAPLPGRVNRVLVTTQGGSVQPGQPLVEIVPSEESLLVETRITPQDIAFVYIGQEAKVAITAYDRAVYGALEGQVVSISPDAVTEERTGETYYVARVRTRKTALTDVNGQPLPIGPGMIAEVNLVGDTRTVLQYILSPITRLSETALREQ